MSIRPWQLLLATVPLLVFDLSATAATLPDPALDEIVTANQAPESIVLAGGCFWGVQNLFQHVKGVASAVSGYAGGQADTAHYEIVSTGTTGHAESVQVTYDPAQITLGKVLQIYFAAAHDPTELNYQGPDHGTQYRSAIFYANDQQKKIAQAYIDQVQNSKVFSDSIATKLGPLTHFYPAEAYHQDYAKLHPDDRYIVVNDLPKVRELQRLFPAFYRE